MPGIAASSASIGKAPRTTSSCSAARAQRIPRSPRSPAPVSTRTAWSTRAKRRSRPSAACAPTASASSTPTAASAWNRSRRRFMDDILRFRDDQPAEEPAVTLDAFLDQDGAVSVRIEAGDDVRLLLPVLDRVRLVEVRSEAHTSELQSLMRISYAVFCLKKKNNKQKHL